MRLQFIVPGPPIAKGRPRFGKGRVFTPQRTEDYEQLVWISALKAGARQLCFGSRPLWLGVQVYIKKPKHPKSTEFPTGRPDLDNYIKCVMDGLKAAFVDDSQIVGILPGTGKFYGDPRLEVVISDEGCPVPVIVGRVRTEDLKNLKFTPGSVIPVDELP